MPPSNFDSIYSRFQHLIATYNIKGILYPAIYEKRTLNKIDTVYPLIEHPEYGITAIRATESYCDKGYIKKYHYEWFRMHPRKGANQKHITSWGNDPHDDPNTPAAFQVSTEPHHHHHDPTKRSNRQASDNVRSFEQAFEHIAPYLENGVSYP